MTVLLISLIILNAFILIFFNKISILINLFDVPDGKRKIHSKKVSQIGGFIFLSNILIFLPYYLLNKDSSNFGYFRYFEALKVVSMKLKTKFLKLQSK